MVSFGLGKRDEAWHYEQWTQLQVALSNAKPDGPKVRGKKDSKP